MKEIDYLKKKKITESCFSKEEYKFIGDYVFKTLSTVNLILKIELIEISRDYCGGKEFGYKISLIKKDTRRLIDTIVVYIGEGQDIDYIVIKNELNLKQLGDEIKQIIEDYISIFSIE